jgi:hypothetical protein
MGLQILTCASNWQYNFIHFRQDIELHWYQYNIVAFQFHVIWFKMYPSSCHISLVLIVFYTLRGVNFWINAEIKELILQRDQLYDGKAILSNICVIATSEEVGTDQCALSCSSYSLECLSFLFSKRLRSCKLLNCNLNEKLVNSSSDDWEYWKNVAGNIKFLLSFYS